MMWGTQPVAPATFYTACEMDPVDEIESFPHAGHARPSPLSAGSSNRTGNYIL